MTRFFNISSNLLAIFLGILILLYHSGCAYRFANLETRQRNSQVRSLAVEGVFDSSQEVLPHDILWAQVQEAIARDGYFLLDSKHRADAIIRLHIADGKIESAGVAGRLQPILDNAGTNTETLNPIDLRQMDRAGVIRPRESVGIRVKAEVIDLRTGKQLFTRSYSQSREYLTNRGEGIAPDVKFIIAEEAISTQMRLLSTDIGRQLVSDLKTKL